MAYVAETIGARPIQFTDMAGEVAKGVTDAATLYAAQQKAQQAKIELENMTIKQDGMKAGIFLDYMDKIRNSPNPSVRKVLEKQYANQHQKMYGQPMDSETFKAISESPDFGTTVQSLVEQMGIEGAGKEYVNMVNKLATSLGLPYVDAEKTMKQAFDYYAEEKKAKQMAEASMLRVSGTQSRFEEGQEGKAIEFESATSKDIETRKGKLANFARNLNIEQKAKKVPELSTAEQIRFDDMLITAYTKMQDPTSVVMPSEYQRTVMASGLFDKLEAMAGRHVLGKGILNPADREIMANYLAEFSKDQISSYNNFVDQQASRVKRRGGDPNTILTQKYLVSKDEKQEKIGTQTALNDRQMQAINQLIDKNITYAQFAAANPNTAKLISENQYNNMAAQRKQGKVTK